MTTTTTRPVGVDELRRAWLAVQDGAFRSTPGTGAPRPAHPTGTHPTWERPERVLPVIGVIPQAGASTVALAVASICGGRVVECCTATASGLAMAVTAELGVTPTGWALGRRDSVHIARTSAIHRCVEEVPLLPDPSDPGSVSVLDVGWDLGQVLTGDGWLTSAVTQADTVLLVTTSTVPALRRLEVAAELLGPDRVVVAAHGPRVRRWPREVRAATGPRTRALLEADRWVPVPHERSLAVRGVDSTPLPQSLLAGAEDLWRRCDVTGHRTKERS